MAKKQANSEFNMSEAIRDILKENPSLSSKEAIDAILAKYPSAKINKNSFSVAFYTGRKKLGINSTGRGKRIAKRKSLGGATTTVRSSIDFAALQATAKFLSEFSSAEAAIEAIKQVQAVQLK
ncbi:MULTISPECIES: hypothetical protein [unclassified Schlesneria]|uniref:hypothetical protein n=1 Tax=Schlesneria TaxID=656899 RepID=UPI0035A01451